MGPTHADLLATLFAYDDARGAPPASAPHSGYQRLEVGGAVAIMDTGPPPPPLMSGEAHAGCLSFEFSADGVRMIVNCGAPRGGDARWRMVARSTAAHSTAVIEDTSSARFAASDWVCRRVGAIMLSGPRHVRAERRGGEGAAVVASHDGYLIPFGIIHERILSLSPAGDRLDGEDLFQAAAPGGQADPAFAIRFHIHPAIRASGTRDGERVVLVTPRGGAWEFAADGAKVALEESVYLGALEGPRRSDQIVLRGRCRSLPAVRWSLQRIAGAPRRGQRPPLPPRAEQLPLAGDEET